MLMKSWLYTWSVLLTLRMGFSVWSSPTPFSSPPGLVLERAGATLHLGGVAGRALDSEWLKARLSTSLRTVFTCVRGSDNTLCNGSEGWMRLMLRVLYKLQDFVNVYHWGTQGVRGVMSGACVASQVIQLITGWTMAGTQSFHFLILCPSHCIPT